MTPVSQGKPYAGNLHVRFEEGASASANAEAEGSTPRECKTYCVKSRRFFAILLASCESWGEAEWPITDAMRDKERVTTRHDLWFCKVRDLS